MWYEVIPCVYMPTGGKIERVGLYIHRRKTNEFIVLDKDMKRVNITSCNYVRPVHDRGQAFFNLNPRWLPYQQ